MEHLAASGAATMNAESAGRTPGNASGTGLLAVFEWPHRHAAPRRGAWGTMVATGATGVARRARSAARLPTCCRRDASPQASTPEYNPAAPPSRISHGAAQSHMADYQEDSLFMFPKPGVGCSIQPGGTTSCLHMAISHSGNRPDSFRIGKIADILPTRLLGLPY